MVVVKWFFIVAGIIAIGVWFIVESVPLIVATIGGASILTGIMIASIEI